jgi:hypothetical protein
MNDKTAWHEAGDALTEISRWRGARKHIQVIRELLMSAREEIRELHIKVRELNSLKEENRRLIQSSADIQTDRGRLMGERQKALMTADTLEKLVIRAMRYQEPSE